MPRQLGEKRQSPLEEKALFRLDGVWWAKGGGDGGTGAGEAASRVEGLYP